MESTLRDLEPVDLLICSETLEHLDDPDAVLDQARGWAAKVAAAGLQFTTDARVAPTAKPEATNAEA
jgi:2-polyprenyl-3-methyl-5-hydroxy-6-metoxy-1,4-benzoquinol methylase